MAISRRAMLISGSAAAIITGGVGLSALIKSTDQARQPWAQAGQGFDDIRLHVLSYAILAPNPHNRQPWLINLSDQEDSAFAVYCDLNRLLPETDPPNRQITIGFGAFLELVSLAAAEQGYRANIIPFPEGEPYPVLDNRPIARVELVIDETVPRDPLFEQVLVRRTNRAAFDVAKIPTAEDLNNLKTIAGISHYNFTRSDDTVTGIKAICQSAWEVEMDTPRTHKESTALTRVGAKAVNAQPDGISISGPAMEAYRLLGIMSPDKMNDPTSQAFAGTRSFYSKLIQSAPAFGWITSAKNDRSDQIKTGREWLRLHLSATQAGMALHPLSQALQEFPEMAPYYKALHETLNVPEPGRIQGLFRLGYAPAPKAAPRWPLETRLIDMSDS